MRTCLALTPLLMAVTSPVAGCASLRGDYFQTIRVESQPPGARVLVDGDAVGTTPTTVVVTPYELHNVRLELAGYPPREYRLRNTVHPLLLLNLALISGAPLGFAIDFVTGSWNDHLTPSAIRASFPEPPAGPTRGRQPNGEGR